MILEMQSNSCWCRFLFYFNYSDEIWSQFFLLCIADDQQKQSNAKSIVEARLIKQFLLERKESPDRNHPNLVLL